jgi:hypothetical protein
MTPCLSFGHAVEVFTMNKEKLFDILSAVAFGLMLAFFLTVRG